MKLASWFSLALALACNDTSSIGHGTLDGRGGQGSNEQADSGTPSVTAGAPSTDASGGVTNEPPGAAECVSTLAATEANDYELVPTFGFELTHVAPNVDLTFDWSGVTADLFGKSLDPKLDVSHLELSLVNDRGTAGVLAEQFMTLSTMTIDLLELDTMGSRTRAGTEDLQVQVRLIPEIDSVLADFDEGAFYDFPYLLSIASTSVTGNQIRMLAPFVLDGASSNTSVMMSSHSTTLAYATSFTGLSPVHIRPHDPHEILDLSQLATDAFGRAFPQTLREVRITEHSTSLDDLAADVMDLDTVAGHVWRAPVGTEKTIDLSTLADDDGQPFRGIDAAGHTWLLALYAHDVIPAPVFLTALEPCTGAQ
jgi:hypothetical protein